MIAESELRSKRLISEHARTHICAIDGNFAIPGEKCDIYDFVGLSASKVAGAMKKIIKGG